LPVDAPDGGAAGARLAAPTFGAPLRNGGHYTLPRRRKSDVLEQNSFYGLNCLSLCPFIVLYWMREKLDSVGQLQYYIFLQN